MNIVDFDRRVVLEVLSQFGDVDVHAACIEIVVHNPDCLERHFTFQHLVCIGTQERQQLTLLGGQLGLLVADSQELALCVEGKLAHDVARHLVLTLASYTTQNGLHTVYPPGYRL